MLGRTGRARTRHGVLQRRRCHRARRSPRTRAREQVVTALAPAYETLTAQVGPKPSDWVWGRVHTMQPVPLLALVTTNYSPGPYARPGGAFTVDVGTPSLSGGGLDFPFGAGGNVRHISLMDPATPVVEDAAARSRARRARRAVRRPRPARSVGQEQVLRLRVRRQIDAVAVSTQTFTRQLTVESPMLRTYLPSRRARCWRRAQPDVAADPADDVRHRGVRSDDEPDPAAERPGVLRTRSTACARRRRTRCSARRRRARRPSCSASFDGKFPSDQEVAITIDFTQTTFDDNGKTTTTSRRISISRRSRPTTFFVDGITGSRAGEVALEPLTAATTSRARDHGTLTIHHKGLAPWADGSYAVVVRGGAGRRQDHRRHRRSARRRCST